jgi:site-specific DNA-methyltransferase (adenine-specific)
MKTLEPNSIDCIIADIPYGKTDCKWDSQIPFDEMWKNIKRIRKDDCVICLFGVEPFSSFLRMSNLKEWHYDWIWIKNRPTGFLQSKLMPLKKYEIINVFYKKNNYYPVMIKRTKEEYKLNKRKHNKQSIGKKSSSLYRNIYEIRKTDFWYKYPINILEFQFKGKRFHPTQKPLKLIEYLVKSYTKPGDTVLDFCMGSGTTGEACYNLNRDFIGIEKDESFYKIAKKRIHDVQLQLELFN